MNKIILLPIMLCALFSACIAQDKEEIRLIVRGDDIGSTHAANLGCIKSYREGIMRTVEVMVPCPWFPEAVDLLNENPGLDVGIHLAITSEWENIKWGPLTHAPSLTGENGYFYPMIWPGEEFPPGKALKAQDWDPEELENEFRAQIEMAISKIPQISHLSCHMGCSSWEPEVSRIYNKLAREYGLEINPDDHGVERMPLKEKGETLSERIENFSEALMALKPGNTYLFVEHPALDTPEMRAVGHSGYYGVATDRQYVTDVFTSEKIMKIIRYRNIRLIAYPDLIK